MRAQFAKAVALLPEATVCVMMLGVGYSLWAIGSVSFRGQSHAVVFGNQGARAPGSLTEAAPFPKILLPKLSELQFQPLPPFPVIPQPAPADDSTRVEHARELLGKFYNRSVVKNGEKIPQVGRFVRQWTRRALKPELAKYSKAIADAVLRESEHHSFDPVFLMAVIENESSFDPHVVGTSGEIGLMQITPTTGAWISKKFGFKWKGKKSLRDPRTNIRIGSAYMAYLRTEFDSHSRLYLAAYNMGSLNVNRALGHSVWPKDYPQRVMKRYIRFYGDLKSEIKNEPKPET